MAVGVGDNHCFGLAAGFCDRARNGLANDGEGARLASHRGLEVVADVVLHHRKRGPRGDARGRAELAVTQIKAGHAISEDHVAIGAVDARVAQSHGKAELLCACAVADDRLGYGEAALLAGVGDDDIGSLALFDGAAVGDDALIVLDLHQVIVFVLCGRHLVHGVMVTRGDAGNGQLVGGTHFNISLALHEGDGSAAVPLGGGDVGLVVHQFVLFVPQGHQELEPGGGVRLDIADNLLLNGQVAGILFANAIGEQRVDILDLVRVIRVNLVAGVLALVANDGSAPQAAQVAHQG